MAGLYGVAVAILGPYRRSVVLALLGMAGWVVIFRWQAVAYAATCISAYAMVWLLCALSVRGVITERTRWNSACAGIVLLGILFVWGRHAGWDAERVQAFEVSIPIFALDMWLALRLVTFVWECGSGQVVVPSPLNFMTWYAMPFLAGGPLLRYSEFEAQREAWQSGSARRPPSAELLGLSGLAFLQLAGGAICASCSKLLTAGEGAGAASKLLMWFGLWPWAFYLWTAGLFHAMEAFAALSGLTIPVSFRYAFLQRNLSEFWARWNITATGVFRDYIFYNRWGMDRPLPYLNTLLTFFLVGLWHGSNAYWIIWGLLHGVGFCAFMACRRIKVEGRRHLLGDGWLGRALATGMTYFFVCSAWILPPQMIKWFSG